MESGLPSISKICLSPLFSRLLLQGPKSLLWCQLKVEGVANSKVNDLPLKVLQHKAHISLMKVAKQSLFNHLDKHFLSIRDIVWS